MGNDEKKTTRMAEHGKVLVQEGDEKHSTYNLNSKDSKKKSLRVCKHHEDPGLSYLRIGQ